MRPPTANQIDLTQSKLFLSTPDRSIRLVQAVRSHLQKKVMYKGSLSGFQVPLHVILTNLQSCYGIWRKQGILGALDIQNYEMWVREFGEAWQSVGWKSTPWLHWMVVHSTAIVKKHCTIRLYSSIPTEYRHRSFKLDIQHSFLGNKLTRPMFMQRGFGHVLSLNFVDLVLKTFPDHKKRKHELLNKD